MPPERPLEMIKEHDRIVLRARVPAEGLEVDDVGTVVHVYAYGKAFEVEFTTLDGETAAVATVEAAAARPVTRHESRIVDCSRAAAVHAAESTYRSPASFGRRVQDRPQGRFQCLEACFGAPEDERPIALKSQSVKKSVNRVDDVG